MRIVALTLGWIGNIFLIVPALVLIFAQWAPSSWLPYPEFIPSELLFEYAFWGAIIGAVIVPLSLLKLLINEKKSTFLIWLKYIFLLILAVVLGGILGYAGTVKAGYVLGNTLASNSLTESTLTADVKSTIHNTNNRGSSRYKQRYCEYNIKTTIGETDSVALYETMFIPSLLCVQKTSYDDTNAGEKIVLLGKENDRLGFFIEGVLTEKDIAEIQRENLKTDQNIDEAGEDATAEPEQSQTQDAEENNQEE